MYFLKNKSEAFDTFRKFKAMVEIESGYEITALRTHSDDEFKSNEFNKCCEEHRIHIPLTIDKTSQHFRVVERKNRIVLNMASYMFRIRRCQKKFTSCAVYLSNRSQQRL